MRVCRQGVFAAAFTFDGFMIGLLVGAVSCNVVKSHFGWNRFYYFILSGFAGAVLLSFFRAIGNYQNFAINKSAADDHVASANLARRQAKSFKRRIEKVKEIKAALGLEQFK